MVRYILFLVVIFGIEKVSFAQLVVGDTVTDFTIVDVHNNEHNLFNYLENGKYVCVDFFGSTSYIFTSLWDWNPFAIAPPTKPFPITPIVFILQLLLLNVISI